jgi:hypothetical protein
VAVLLDLERLGPRILDRVAEAMQRADARVAAPGEDELARAAGADQLVVDDVRRHPHERQVAAALTNELVPGRNGYQVGEALERDRVAVVDEVGDGMGQRGDGGGARHDPIRSYTARTYALRTRAASGSETGEESMR